jgi:beta-glucosidase
MTLDLFGQQDELVKAIVALGKPVVVYLMNGRPLSINYIEQNVPAIIEGWYMGQATGEAAADIIFGNVNPSGKLTITVPKSAGQLPMYYNFKPSAQINEYLSMDNRPLYYFGYGLSYTKFRFANLRLDKGKIRLNGSLKVKVEVTNTGKTEGDEIVQLYIRDKVSSVTRPVKELRGFRRISLKPTETKTVTFELTPEQLAFHDINMKFVVEPGDFEVMVGNSSRDEDLLKTTLTVN